MFELEMQLQGCTPTAFSPGPLNPASDISTVVVSEFVMRITEPNTTAENRQVHPRTQISSSRFARVCPPAELSTCPELLCRITGPRVHPENGGRR